MPPLQRSLRPPIQAPQPAPTPQAPNIPPAGIPSPSESTSAPMPDAMTNPSTPATPAAHSRMPLGKITRPAEGQSLLRCIAVHGTAQEIPTGMMLWIVLATPAPSVRYYLQAEVKFEDPRVAQWRASRVIVGANESKQPYYRIYLVLVHEGLRSALATVLASGSFPKGPVCSIQFK